LGSLQYLWKGFTGASGSHWSVPQHLGTEVRAQRGAIHDDLVAKPWPCYCAAGIIREMLKAGHEPEVPSFAALAIAAAQERHRSLQVWNVNIY